MDSGVCDSAQAKPEIRMERIRTIGITLKKLLFFILKTFFCSGVICMLL